MNKQEVIQIATRNIVARRNNAIDKCERLKEKLRRCPDWVECDKNLRIAQVDYVMNGQKASDKQRIEQYKAQQLELMKKYKITPEMLQPQYACKKCNDTGYVGNVMCGCLHEEIRKLLVKDSNVANTDFTFANSTETNKHNVSVYKKAQQVCKDATLKNILLIGATGTGKTYLLSACANECLANSQSVLFTTAYALNETMLECHLAGYETKQLIMQNLLDVDVLCIDDLGTENVYRNVTAEYLFVVLNERLSRGKQTFISSNLTLADIRDRYDERIFSRIVNQKITFVAQLVGDDKRL